MSAYRGHSLFKKLLRMEGVTVSYLPFSLDNSEEFEGWEEGIDCYDDAESFTALVMYEFTERVLIAIGEDIEYNCVLELSTEELTGKDIDINDKDLFEVEGRTYHVTRVKPARMYGGESASVLVALKEGKP